MTRYYYRPIPAPETGCHRIAGGWARFSQVERLTRGEPAEIFNEAPPSVMERLTAPRASIVGLDMGRPCIMGIVNATPDSFSDGGTYDPVQQAQRLLTEGADILDIGGESTRPGATEQPVEKETARILPVIEAMAGCEHAVPISVDTRKATVARAAIDAGASLVNDVSGFDFDPALPRLVQEAGVPVCLMHAQGLPENMQRDPQYDNVLLDVYDALERRVLRAESAGIPRTRILIDPGIGFGKTEAHNLAIMRRLSLFHGLGCAILLGVSRKRFIGRIGGAVEASDRGPGTIALTLAGLAQGVQIHRVHDVAQVKQAIALQAALDER